MFENSQVLPFYGIAGTKGKIPVSFNVVAVKPGITVNLTACMKRTDEALDRWRLDTFQQLYQAHLQLLAEWENKTYISGGRPDGLSKSPGTMRLEEQAAVKELILNALNNYHTPQGNQYSFERINLFENAVDWDNISYKLYNYGPNSVEVNLEKLGTYNGVDNRRKAFLKAHWAQVMIPLKADPHLEAQMTNYFRTGVFDFEEDFAGNMDELAVFYQDLINERSELEETPVVKPIREDVIPTDLIVINTDDIVSMLPKNTQTPCEIQPQV
jgi:hypothetical protein